MAEQKAKSVRKGGMQWNGLRGATEVTNYMPGAGRQNLIPGAHSNNPNVISSIGQVQRNGLRGDTSGAGTLESTNVQIGGGTGRQVGSVTETQQGKTMMNDKRTQFVDYRQTDPFIVENLRNNPLSIYAVGDAKTVDLPQFFVDSKPKDFGTYITDQYVPVSNFTKETTIDGSPQANILGLAEHNPFMGVSSKFNTQPFEYNKGYGGSDNSDATGSLDRLTSSMWKGNHFEEGNCNNKALAFASPGYNSVSHQINAGVINEWGSRTNLPYGPGVSTGNPQTQQGGVWGASNGNIPARNFEQYFHVPIQKQSNQYTNGLPGSIIAR